MSIEYELDIIITSIQGVGGAWLLQEITSQGYCTLKQTNGNRFEVRHITELINF